MNVKIYKFSVTTGPENCQNLLILSLTWNGKDNENALQVSNFPFILHPKPLVRMIVQIEFFAPGTNIASNEKLLLLQTQVTYSINFVHKYNAWLMISCIGKHFSDQPGTLSNILINNGTRHNLKCERIVL